MIGEHLRYLSDFFSAIVKCIWKKYSKKVLIWSLQSLAAASIQKNGKKSLQCLWPPKMSATPPSLHQINLTIFFHFLSLDSIDYIMIILELISPQQRTIEQKYLLTTQKITIIKKKEDRILSPPSCPPAINYRSSRKSQFLVNWPDKKHKKNTKIWPPHIFID